jgi:hypothetical protein
LRFETCGSQQQYKAASYNTYPRVDADHPAAYCPWPSDKPPSGPQWLHEIKARRASGEALRFSEHLEGDVAEDRFAGLL